MAGKIKRIEGHSREGIVHWCPGCESPHAIYTKAPEGKPTWTWDGDEQAPTTNPSVRCFDNEGTICHYFLRAGKIEYCGDCRHALSGKTVDLPDWPYASGEFAGVKD